MRQSSIGVFPEEVFQMVLNYVNLPLPFTKGEAKNYWKELMEERGSFNSSSGKVTGGELYLYVPLISHSFFLR